MKRKRFTSFLLAFVMVILSLGTALCVGAASFEPGKIYTEKEIQQMRDEANTYENISQKVSTQVFDWINADRIVFLNAQEGAFGFGHSALILLDKKDRGVFFSYYPAETDFPKAIICDGDVRMKYLSQQDIRNFWITGTINNAVSTAHKEETITDGGYNRGILKYLFEDSSLIYEKMIKTFKSPQTYLLFGHQCDDVALSLFCESETEFLAIWGSTFINPTPNATYNDLACLATMNNQLALSTDGERYRILADFLINERIDKTNTAPSETANEDPIAFGMYQGEEIDMPKSFVLSSEGVMPDGRKYKKYYFADEDVLFNENAVISSGDLVTRYLICIGDTIIEEMFLLFAKAGNDVLVVSMMKYIEKYY